MGKHGLNWTDYSAFCYDSWQEETDSEGNIIPAGGVYSFRKERAASVDAPGDRRKTKVI
ncbi:hypothetical protein LNP74_08345 [Klebsiella pneumoniae subsp. pneumoniae]|nr:hypothetical protein [Klebsiella pneumoniae subsp. pneumoniae]